MFDDLEFGFIDGEEFDLVLGFIESPRKLNYYGRPMPLNKYSIGDLLNKVIEPHENSKTPTRILKNHTDIFSYEKLVSNQSSKKTEAKSAQKEIEKIYSKPIETGYSFEKEIIIINPSLNTIYTYENNSSQEINDSTVVEQITILDKHILNLISNDFKINQENISKPSYNLIEVLYKQFSSINYGISNLFDKSNHSSVNNILQQNNSSTINKTLYQSVIKNVNSDNNIVFKQINTVNSIENKDFIKNNNITQNSKLEYKEQKNELFINHLNTISNDFVTKISRTNNIVAAPLVLEHKTFTFDKKNLITEIANKNLSILYEYQYNLSGIIKNSQEQVINFKQNKFITHQVSNNVSLSNQDNKTFNYNNISVDKKDIQKINNSLEYKYITEENLRTNSVNINSNDISIVLNSYLSSEIHNQELHTLKLVSNNNRLNNSVFVNSFVQNKIDQINSTVNKSSLKRDVFNINNIRKDHLSKYIQNRNDVQNNDFTQFNSTNNQLDYENKQINIIEDYVISNSIKNEDITISSQYISLNSTNSSNNMSVTNKTNKIKNIVDNIVKNKTTISSFNQALNENVTKIINDNVINLIENRITKEEFNEKMEYISFQNQVNIVNIQKYLTEKFTQYNTYIQKQQNTQIKNYVQNVLNNFIRS